MALKPGEDIGMEKHATHDQFFRVEEGAGEISIDGVTHKVKSGTAIVVPAGALHNLINTGDEAMKIYTIYAPPQSRRSAGTGHKSDRPHVIGAF